MQRADLLLVQLGLVQSRTHAQRLIKKGNVSFWHNENWQVLSKPGLKLDTECKFQVIADAEERYVSRGALKLEAALSKLPEPVQGKTAIDIGQSTGGFTDCLLQAGVTAVVGIEVGHDQLADKLRKDTRVTCYEGMNARELPESMLLEHTDGNGFDLAVMDVSFISQRKILPSLAPLIRHQGFLISLVKPQFEVGKANIGRGGIVRDSELYPEVERMIKECCEELQLSVVDYLESPITGGDGNREFLLIAQKGK